MSKNGGESVMADELPGFLATADADGPGGGKAPDTAAAAAEDDLAMPDVAAAEPAAAAVADEYAAAPSPRRERRRTVLLASSGADHGGSAIAVGLLAAVGAAVTLVLPGLTPIADLPTWLVVAAVAAFAAAGVRRHLARAMVDLHAAVGRHEELSAAVLDELQSLASRPQGPDPSSARDATGNELDRLLVLLQRQDEKVNNLTKAIKMYGKPMMEIANQGADAAALIGQVKTLVEAALEASRQGFGRLEALARAGGNQQGDATELRAALAQMEQQLQRCLAGFADRLPSIERIAVIEQVPPQLTRVEATVQALGQRLDDSEVRKSLLRLEDSAKVLREALQQLQQGDLVHDATQRLEQRLDSTAQRLHGGLEQLQKGNLGSLETTVRDIQRELAGVATAVSQIQAAVKSGNRAAAAAATAAASPAPATTPRTTATTTEADANPATAVASAAPAPEAAATAPSDAQAGAAQNQTGTRATSGKNVLGAIARLKQMKN